jgi:hypothetical protein
MVKNIIIELKVLSVTHFSFADITEPAFEKFTRVTFRVKNCYAIELDSLPEFSIPTDYDEGLSELVGKSFSLELK